MTSSRRYWLAIHPDISKPIGGVKQMHRFAEALVLCGRQATLIQEQADFHPGWFESQVDTISLASWRQRSDLTHAATLWCCQKHFCPPFPIMPLACPS